MQIPPSTGDRKMRNCGCKKQSFYSIELLITNEKTNEIRRKKSLK